MSNPLQNVVPAIGADYNSVSTAWIVMKSLQVVRWSLRHKIDYQSAETPMLMLHFAAAYYNCPAHACIIGPSNVTYFLDCRLSFCGRLLHVG